MQRLILSLALSLVVGLAALVPNTTTASDANADVPPEVTALMKRLESAGDRIDEVVDNLSDEERDLVRLYISVADERVEIHQTNVASSSEVQPMASGCWDRTATAVGENIWGADLYKYSQRMRWCGDGQFIHTRAQATQSVATPSVWWSYQGLVSTWTSGGIGWNGFESFRQGHFRGCASPALCDNAFPTVYQHGGGNGFYHQETNDG